jgi:hypothetical protein
VDGEPLPRLPPTVAQAHRLHFETRLSVEEVASRRQIRRSTALNYLNTAVQAGPCTPVHMSTSLFAA